MNAKCDALDAAAAARINNVGPAGNYAAFPGVAELALCVAMIMGRLEILGVLVLFLPSFYR